MTIGDHLVGWATRCQMSVFNSFPEHILPDFFGGEAYLIYQIGALLKGFDTTAFLPMWWMLHGTRLKQLPYGSGVIDR